MTDSDERPKYDRHELMQQASRGLPMLQLSQCAVCGTLIGWHPLTMPDGEYQMIVRLVRITGHCALPERK